MPSDVFRPRLPLDPFAGTNNIDGAAPWRIPASLPSSPPQVILVIGEPHRADLLPLLASPRLSLSLVLIATHDPAALALPPPSAASASGPAVRVLHLSAPLDVHDAGALRLVSLFERAQRVARLWRHSLSAAGPGKTSVPSYPHVIQLTEDGYNGEFTIVEPYPYRNGTVESRPTSTIQNQRRASIQRYPSPAPSIVSFSSSTSASPSATSPPPKKNPRSRFSLSLFSLSTTSLHSPPPPTQNKAPSISSSQNKLHRTPTARSQLVKSTSFSLSNPTGTRAFDAVVNFLPMGLEDKALLKHTILVTTLSAQYLTLPEGDEDVYEDDYRELGVSRRKSQATAPIQKAIEPPTKRPTSPASPIPSSPPSTFSKATSQQQETPHKYHYRKKSLSRSPSGSSSNQLPTLSSLAISSGLDPQEERHFSAASSSASAPLSSPSPSSPVRPAIRPVVIGSGSTTTTTTTTTTNSTRTMTTPGTTPATSPRLGSRSGSEFGFGFGFAVDEKELKAPKKGQEKEKEKRASMSLTRRISMLLRAPQVQWNPEAAAVAETAPTGVESPSPRLVRRASQTHETPRAGLGTGSVRRVPVPPTPTPPPTQMPTPKPKARQKTRVRTKPRNSHVVHVLPVGWGAPPAPPSSFQDSYGYASSSGSGPSRTSSGRSHAYAQQQPQHYPHSQHQHQHQHVQRRSAFKDDKPKLVQGIEQFLLSFAYPLPVPAANGRHASSMSVPVSMSMSLSGPPPQPRHNHHPHQQHQNQTQNQHRNSVGYSAHGQLASLVDSEAQRQRQYQHQHQQQRQTRPVPYLFASGVFAAAIGGFDALGHEDGPMPMPLTAGEAALLGALDFGFGFGLGEEGHGHGQGWSGSWVRRRAWVGVGDVVLLGGGGGVAGEGRKAVDASTRLPERRVEVVKVHPRGGEEELDADSEVEKTRIGLPREDEDCAPLTGLVGLPTPPASESSSQVNSVESGGESGASEDEADAEKDGEVGGNEEHGGEVDVEVEVDEKEKEEKTTSVPEPQPTPLPEVVRTVPEPLRMERVDGKPVPGLPQRQPSLHGTPIAVSMPTQPERAYAPVAIRRASLSRTSSGSGSGSGTRPVSTSSLPLVEDLDEGQVQAQARVEGRLQALHALQGQSSINGESGQQQQQKEKERQYDPPTMITLTSPTVGSPPLASSSASASASPSPPSGGSDLTAARTATVKRKELKVPRAIYVAGGDVQQPERVVSGGGDASTSPSRLVSPAVVNEEKGLKRPHGHGFVGSALRKLGLGSLSTRKGGVKVDS